MSFRLSIHPFTPDSRPERADFRPEKIDFRPERIHFRPEKADFRSERAWGGGRTEGRTNESLTLFYRTSSPSRPLPCFLSLQFTIIQSRATGIADHIMPLGDLFFRLLDS